MPAVPEWDVLLRGGVLRALGQRGCRSGSTVSNFRGRARLHITARAGDGHRKQLLLPYPWESDQLEAIRDGVAAVYEAFQHGVPLELAIAELGAAKAEADARRQAEALVSQPSSLQLSASPPATPSRSIQIDWAGLIRRYEQHKLRSGEIKETTWERLYKPRMALLLKTAKGPPAARDSTQLLEAQAPLCQERSPPGLTSPPGGQQQLLRWHRWSALPGVEHLKGAMEFSERLVSQPADPPRRMGGRDSLLNGDVGEQCAAALLLTSHQIRFG